MKQKQINFFWCDNETVVIFQRPSKMCMHAGLGRRGWRCRRNKLSRVENYTIGDGHIKFTKLGHSLCLKFPTIKRKSLHFLSIKHSQRCSPEI